MLLSKNSVGKILKNGLNSPFLAILSRKWHFRGKRTNYPLDLNIKILSMSYDGASVKVKAKCSQDCGKMAKKDNFKGIFRVFNIKGI